MCGLGMIMQGEITDRCLSLLELKGLIGTDHLSGKLGDSLGGYLRGPGLACLSGVSSSSGTRNYFMLAKLK